MTVTLEDTISLNQLAQSDKLQLHIKAQFRHAFGLQL